MENFEKERKIDIDNKKIFQNPFQSLNSVHVNKMMLYRQFLISGNYDTLQLINNAEIVTNENSEYFWTRSEILQSIACKYHYRTIPTVITRDILENTAGIIVQQVNCQGVMNVGLAKQIREKWPIVFEEYQKRKVKTLGSMQLILVEPAGKYSEYPLYVCNIFGQLGYGTNQQQTNYQGVKKAFIKLKKELHRHKLPIFIPYMMGCGLGGGDWNKYLSIIFKIIPEIIICKKPNNQ